MSRCLSVKPHLSIPEIDEYIRTCRHSVEMRQWMVIRHALSEPSTSGQISQHVGLSAGSVRNLIARYNQQGPSSLRKPKRKQQPNAYLSNEEEKKTLQPLIDRSEQGELVTTQEIQQTFEKRVGQTVAPSTISRLLARHSWRKLAPRPRHPKSDPQKQEEFKQQFPQKVQELIATRSAEDSRPVRVMCQDEGRFGRINAPRRCWAPHPIRPEVYKQVVRESLFVFVAVCPQLGRLSALILPYANTAMMKLFLDHVSEEFKDSFIVMLVDQASWHTSEKLQVPENIRLLPQPPGSPELNPAEHIWDDLREKEMKNFCFKSLDGVEDVLSQGIQRLDAHPDYLSSLTRFPYFRLS